MIRALAFFAALGAASASAASADYGILLLAHGGDPAGTRRAGGPMRGRSGATGPGR